MAEHWWRRWASTQVPPEPQESDGSPVDLLEAENKELRCQVQALMQERGAWTAELTQIKVALGRVSVYQDMVDVSPTALLVAGVVDDHEELEARIERVLDLILVRRGFDGLTEDTPEYQTLNTIAGLLQGQITNAPNDIGELDGQ